jgi:hypothetical protein
VNATESERALAGDIASLQPQSLLLKVYGGEAESNGSVWYE